MIVTRRDRGEIEGQIAADAPMRVTGLNSDCSVSPITAGCSKISFFMKWR